MALCSGARTFSHRVPATAARIPSKARFARTKYGPLLGHHEYSVLKEGFFHYRCDWCRKWLRFSTDPTLVMLCYVWLARCEVQDLDHIIEGVHYKLPSEDVQPLLVGFDEKD